MKSTGLFGKNSGRVGGVVYSNYRGEQIVRAYQPKVNNPNTAGQVAQRAKFKLVTQVGASLAKEIGLSFLPSKSNQSPRNAFLAKMLKKTVYNNDIASLPIEDVILTNSIQNGFLMLQAQDNRIQGILSSNFSENAKVRVVRIAYNEGGEITLIDVQEPEVQVQESQGVVQLGFSSNPFYSIQGYTNIRALVYAYEPDFSSGVSYEDYEMTATEAILSDVRRIFRGAVRFSETMNILMPQNV